jgi:hypothetical protein
MPTPILERLALARESGDPALRELAAGVLGAPGGEEGEAQPAAPDSGP